MEHNDSVIISLSRQHYIPLEQLVFPFPGPGPYRISGHGTLTWRLNGQSVVFLLPLKKNYDENILSVLIKILLHLPPPPSIPFDICFTCKSEKLPWKILGFLFLWEKREGFLQNLPFFSSVKRQFLEKNSSRTSLTNPSCCEEDFSLFWCSYHLYS